MQNFSRHTTSIERTQRPRLSQVLDHDDDNNNNGGNGDALGCNGGDNINNNCHYSTEHCECLVLLLRIRESFGLKVDYPEVFVYFLSLNRQLIRITT
jgi:hypothetical protein